LLGLAAVFSGAVLGLLAALRRGAQEAFAFRDGNDEITPEITPNDKFYVVSKNFADPQVNVPEWRLEVTGLVERPFSLNHVELLALPSSEQIQTLECISNPIGGDLISTA